MREKQDVEYAKLLEELKNTEMQLAIVTSAKFDKETKEKVDVEVAKKGDYVAAQAKTYGQNPNEADGTLAAYSSSLEAVRGEFTLEKDALLVETAKLNQVELENLADARGLQIDLRDETLSEEERTKKEAMLNGCRIVADSAVIGSDHTLESVDEVTSEFDEFFDGMVEDKSLVEAEKQGPLAKLFKRITSRVNGKKKFATEVIAPLDTKTKEIEEVKLEEAKEVVASSLSEKVKGVLDKVKEKVSELGDWAVDKMKALRENEKLINGLILAAKTAGTLVGIYSAINLGFDLSVTVGEMIKEKMTHEGPALA